MKPKAAAVPARFEAPKRTLDRVIEGSDHLVDDRTVLGFVSP
jgi:hypothetical protein